RDLRGRNLLLLGHPDADPVVLPRINACRVRRTTVVRAGGDVCHGLHLPHEHYDGERLHDERGLYEVPAETLVRLEARRPLLVREEVRTEEHDCADEKQPGEYEQRADVWNVCAKR